MPARNRVKTYVENGYYHVYNRGVEKRKVFLDDQDHRVFLHLLKSYLSPPSDDLQHPLAAIADSHPIRPRPLVVLYGQVELLAYCLLPNHFHLLLRQQTREGMSKLLQALSTTYVLYFNRRYNRVGRLFQDTYKAAWVGEGTTGDRYLLHLSRYIHLNPKFELTRPGLVSWPYSSYEYYLGEKSGEWVNPQPILNYFTQVEDLKHTGTPPAAAYQKFVEVNQTNPREVLGRLVIE